MDLRLFYFHPIHKIFVKKNIYKTIWKYYFVCDFYTFNSNQENSIAFKFPNFVWFECRHT